MSRRIRRIGCVALALMCTSTWAAPHDHPPPLVLAPGYGPLEYQPPAAGSYALPPLGEAADGPVIAASGRSLRLHDLLGDKIVVMSFIYTTCNDVNGCPLATWVFKQVQDRIAQLPDLRNRVRLISFSFDPDHDTPEVMQAYAGHFRATDFDWRFITTPSQTVLDPTLEAYGQWVIRDYDAEGNPLGTMSHLLRVFLIDQHLKIRNIYSVSFLHADTVARDVETLLLEARPDSSH